MGWVTLDFADVTFLSISRWIPAIERFPAFEASNTIIIDILLNLRDALWDVVGEKTPVQLLGFMLSLSQVGSTEVDQTSNNSRDQWWFIF